MTSTINNQRVLNDFEPLNTSYRVVNEKVFKLKRLEFDYSNLCEVIKNYIVVQEIIVKHLFLDSQQVQKESLSKQDSFKSKIEVLDIFTILRPCRTLARLLQKAATDVFSVLPLAPAGQPITMKNICGR